MCRGRTHISGKLYSLNYDKISSIAMDPIEKKPLYRYHPGSHILSVGTFGCNLRCRFCQNHDISQGNPHLFTITPKQLVEQALSRRNNLGIAYTYNEPSIWYEYVYDTARLARTRKLKNVMVTNGYLNPEPLAELYRYIDAANIDLKSFREEFYREICGGELSKVKDSIMAVHGFCHLEITFLAIPDLNDSDEEMEKLASWMASVSRDIPLHIIRFRPLFQMRDHPGQTYGKVLRLQEIAGRHLFHVYAHS